MKHLFGIVLFVVIGLKFRIHRFLCTEQFELASRGGIKGHFAKKTQISEQLKLELEETQI